MEADSRQLSVLIYHQSGEVVATIWATLTREGDLAFMGHDTGVLVEASFGASAYEYAMVVPAAFVPKVRQAVGSDTDPTALLEGLRALFAHQSQAPAISTWLTSALIRYELTTYVD